MAVATPQFIQMPTADIRKARLRIVGDSELILHNWSQKAKQEMLDKQMGKAREKKAFKDPLADYESGFYRMPGDQ